MYRNVFFWIIVLVGLVVGCSPDSTAPANQSARISAIDSLIQREIAADHIPGAVIQIKKGDSVLHRAAYGYAQKYDYGLKRLEDPVQMTTAYFFDLASLTKVMGTTFGIMIMADNEALELDDPVHKYLSEFKKGEKSEITIRHLLTHTSGLPQWVPTYYYASNTRERYQYIASLPLKWPVGAERHYSDLGFMLLGDIIEQVSGQRLDEYLEKELYTPLNLEHTTYNPLNKETVAATSHGNPFEKQMVHNDSFGYQVDVEPESWNNWREYTLRGEVNDGNAWYANNGVAGHAGLFSTIDDLQALVDLLIERGKVNGRSFISPSIIDTFLTKDQYDNALGWAMDKKTISAKGSPEGTIGHTGFTGTNIVVVPQDSLSIILLTNRQNVGRQENGYYFDLGPLRQDIFDKVIQEIN